MSNKIDDQERVRSIQSRIISEFNRSILDPTSVLTDADVVERTYSWIIDQVKLDFARRLANLETCLRCDILLSPQSVLDDIREFYDILNSALREAEDYFLEQEKEVDHEA